MLALLFALAMVALTLFVFAVAGVMVGVATGLVLLNVSVVILGLIVNHRRSPPEPAQPETWRPASFRLPPEPPYESEERSPSLTIHRQ
jgi:hypothetical protein